jgi:trehalose utilization protein
MENIIRVTVWNEYRHERDGEAKEFYPNGIQETIREFLAVNKDMKITTAVLDDPEQGLPDTLLENTDVLIWWGHMHHQEVNDALVEKIRERVYCGGMGFIGLHSAHHSKPFRAIVGCTGNLKWGDNQKEVIWNLAPSHPIAQGVPESFELESEELYSEPFFIPQPDELVFGSWYEHGNIFRSGCTFYRGMGRVFYFQPGHEVCRSFYNPHCQQIITNAVRWARPHMDTDVVNACPYTGKGFYNE